MEDEHNFTQQFCVPETSFTTPKTPPPPTNSHDNVSSASAAPEEECLNFTQPFHFQTPAAADGADDSAINSTQAFEFQTPSIVKRSHPAAGGDARKTKVDDLNFDLAGATQDFGSPTCTTIEHDEDLQGATQNFENTIPRPLAVEDENEVDEIESLASDADKPDDSFPSEHDLKIANNDEPNDDSTVKQLPSVNSPINDATNDVEDEEELSFQKRSKPTRRRISDDDDDNDQEDEPPAEDDRVITPIKTNDVTTGSPEHDDEASEQEEKKSEVGELIADIFGDSDDDETGAAKVDRPQDEETNKDDDDGEVSTSNNLPNKDDDLYQEGDEDEQQQQQGGGDDDDRLGDDEEPDGRVRQDDEEEFVSDFDLMMDKRRKQSQRWRKRRGNYEFVTYSDDMIAELLSQMRLAAKEDMDLNSMQMPATRKRTLLPLACRELRKADLVSGFIEAGVVSVMAQWLSPLPDKSLPALEIRTDFLKLLLTFPTLDHQILRSSNIGKAVMLLLKHPKETKENKERARKLINEWARPIFNLQTDYRSLSKDERIKRDYDHMPVAKKRRMSLEGEQQPSISSKGSDKKTLGPGDKGFIGRARVPRPSTKDYVVRPKWNVETEFRQGGSKKQVTSKMDKKIREIKMKTAPRKTLHAVGISLEGRKMAI